MTELNIWGKSFFFLILFLHSKLISSYQNDSEFHISITLGLKDYAKFPSPRNPRVFGEGNFA
jgi:hypothetical protein